MKEYMRLAAILFVGFVTGFTIVSGLLALVGFAASQGVQPFLAAAAGLLIIVATAAILLTSERSI